MNLMNVTETELGASAASQSSYFGTGLPSDTPIAYHSSRGAVTDVVPNGVPAETEVIYLPPFESSASIVTLLNDKIDSQSKATITQMFCIFCFSSMLLFETCLTTYEAAWYVISRASVCL